MNAGILAMQMALRNNDIILYLMKRENRGGVV